MYKSFKENKLDYFNYAGTSTITDKHYKDRLEQTCEYSLYSILLVDKKHLRLTFHAFPTMFGHVSRSNTYDNVSKTYYTIQIQFLDIDKVFDLKKILTISSKDIEKIADNCEVQFYSNDESFYWQGFWEDLDSNNSAIYPFNGTHGKGVWRQTHQDSGGLTDSKKRITKHIKQLIEDFDLILENQVKRYLKNHIIKSIKSSNKLQEKYTDYQKAQLDSFESQIKKILSDPKFKLKDKFTIPKIEKELDEIYGESTEVNTIKNIIKNIILNNYKIYGDVFNKIKKIEINEITGQPTVYRLSETFKDKNVLDFLNEIYNIKPNKKGHVDVGRGEILFAAILKDFKFSDYGDLINSSGELLEIKSVNGKFRGSKNFDYNIRNLNFAEFFGSELAKNTDISDEAKGNLANYLQDFRPLSLTVCKETYNNFIETIDLFPNEAENLKKFFREEFVRELLYTLLADDVIKDHIIGYGVNQLTDDAFKDANTLRQTVYKILIAVNYTIYVTNEYEKKKLKYIIFCKDLDNDIQYVALNIESDVKVLVNEFFKPGSIFEELGIEFKLSLNKHSRGTTSFKMNSFLVEDMYDVCTDAFREIFTPFIEKSKYVTNYISTDSNTQIKAYIYVEKSLFIIKVTDLKNDNIDKQKIMYKLEANGSTYKLATLDDEEDYAKSENFKNLKQFKNKDELKQYLETELEKIKSNI